MSESTIPATEPVAAPGPAPYTAEMDIGRPAPVPWWREAVRSWVPVLGIAVLLVFQMVSLQQQIGDLWTDIQRDMGDLRTDLEREIGTLRTEMGDLRDDLRTEIGELRDDLRTEIGALGERITRLETLLESRPGS